MQSEIHKPGAELAINHCMRMFGRVHRVIRFNPYPDFGQKLGLPDYTARIAVFDTGVEMTVIDQNPVRVLEA